MKELKPLQIERLENSLSDLYGTEYPTGSAMMDLNGNFSENNIEGHIVMIEEALRKARIKLKSVNYSSGYTQTDKIIDFLNLTGFVRLHIRTGYLNIEVSRPLTSGQIRALKNLVIEKNYEYENILIDVNNNKEDNYKDNWIRDQICNY